MTTTIANVGNTDIVDFSIEQTGSPRTEVYLEEPLLDGTKDYMVAVTELCVPLSEEPMMTFSLADRDLFTIRRRKAGNTITNYTINNVGTGIPAALAPQLEYPETFKVFAAGDFLALVAQWCAGFSRRYYVDGLAETHHQDTVPAGHDVLRPAAGNSLLAVSLSPSGVFQFRGTALFWRNFFIVPNAYARELFGFSETTLCLTAVAGVYLKDASLLTNIGNVIQDSAIGDVPPLNYAGNHSVFRFLDERMYISLEAGDLALAFNQLIRDGVESKTHELVSFPFDTQYKTTIRTSNGIVQASVDVEMNTFISRTHFLRKTDPTVSWYPLKSSAFVQNMRLELFITRRRFSAGKWIYTKEPVRMHDDGVWNVTLKFISIH